MKTRIFIGHSFRKSLIFCLTSFGVLSYAHAQNTLIEEIIVTGTAKPTTKFESSMSVTALPADEIQNFAPRSTSELFRTIPGIQSESTGGDANANIKIRGLPISSGGARYLSIQEDGLPALIIGDFAFATADSFVRLDQTIASVQSIRGGSASTQASNSPGGIINMLSKTGEEAGGMIGLTAGLDYDSTRLDFAYGSPIDDNWRFHVGGYFRKGEGPREAPSDFEEGGQIKANLTREFDNGFIRFNLKVLDDNVPTYLPIPARFAGGTNYQEVGVNFSDGTLLLDTTDFTVRTNGVQASDTTRGFESKMTSLGMQLEFQLSDTFTVSNNFRVADIEGQFISPFPASTFNLSDGSGIGTELVQFNTKLDDFGNTLNDFKLSADLGTVQVTAGLFYADQKERMQWAFNQYYRQLNADRTPFDVEFFDADGNPVASSVGGVFYGNPAFGNCCQRLYDFDITNVAPSLTVSGSAGDNINWDVSVRHDDYDVDGVFIETSVQRAQDINGDGSIAANELLVNNFGTANSADYSASFTSYSAGLNWEFADGFAAFANISKGGSLTAPDRTTSSIVANGNIRGEEFVINEVTQQEIGLKYQGDLTDIYVTFFNAETEESPQFGVTTQRFTQSSFESKGVEVEASYGRGDGFSISGSVTLTDAEISDSADASIIGNKPRRQADYIFNVTPQYNTEKWTLGAVIVGSDEVFTQNNNVAKFDSYVTANAFFNYYFNEKLSLSINANNLFDEEAFTEGEEGSPAIGDFVRIRPINGRTTSATIRYEF